METNLAIKGSLRSATSVLLDKLIGTGSINWAALALIRFVLAFIVVVFHMADYTSSPINWIARFDAFNAILGFLLISGLSIGKSILKNENGYYLRRAERIYPIYIASIVLHYLVTPEAFSLNLLFTGLANLFFLNQLATTTSYVPPAWTLALEVWLYILAPFFLKMSYRTLLYLSCASFCLYIFYVCGRTLLHFPYYAGLGYGLNLLVLSYIWIAGFMMAVSTKKLKTTALLIAVFFAAHSAINYLIDIAYGLKHHQSYAAFQETNVNLLFSSSCLIVVYIAVICTKHIPKFSLIKSKVFNFLGNISYPLYLSHYSILILCKKLHITNWLSMLALCFLTAAVIYFVFDFYSRKRTA